ncbi:hypothetical protein [Bacillus thuringiensis]|nr:hypothetical protein [Bacillus thuringiensis]
MKRDNKQKKGKKNQEKSKWEKYGPVLNLLGGVFRVVAVGIDKFIK